MALSRKRRRELRHLRSHAQDLLDEQRIVLGRAGVVMQEASRQARNLSDEHLAPRVEGAMETVRPAVDCGVTSARRAASRVRRVAAPLVANALASTVRTLDQLENHDAAKQVQRFGEKRGLVQKKKSGAGGVVALSIGIVAAAGVGYALWQAFRTDDELWVAPEE
ncbi:MAG: DNA/RNA helicase [Leucobacter sp.]